MITKLTLEMVKSLELNFFKKHTTRGHNQIGPLARKMSMIYMWILDILPSLLPVPPLKTVVFTSPVLSSHVKIALWAWPSNMP